MTTSVTVSNVHDALVAALEDYMYNIERSALISVDWSSMLALTSSNNNMMHMWDLSQTSKINSCEGDVDAVTCISLQGSAIRNDLD